MVQTRRSVVDSSTLCANYESGGTIVNVRPDAGAVGLGAVHRLVPKHGLGRATRATGPRFVPEDIRIDVGSLALWEYLSVGRVCG